MTQNDTLQALASITPKRVLGSVDNIKSLVDFKKAFQAKLFVFLFSKLLCLVILNTIGSPLWKTIFHWQLCFTTVIAFEPRGPFHSRGLYIQSCKHKRGGGCLLNNHWKSSSTVIAVKLQWGGGDIKVQGLFKCEDPSKNINLNTKELTNAHKAFLSSF